VSIPRRRQALRQLAFPYSASGAANTQLAVLGTTFFAGLGSSSKVFGPQSGSATFDITFTAGESAVGFDAFPGPFAGNIAISLFSPSNDLLGTSTISGSVGPNFFGVVSTTDLIGRVSLAAPSLRVIDNLAFGTVAVPEPSSLLLFAGGGRLLVGCGVLRSCDIAAGLEEIHQCAPTSHETP